MAELNSKVILGIGLMLASFIIWFIPFVGCVCPLVFLAGAVLLIVGLVEKPASPVAQ